MQTPRKGVRLTAAALRLPPAPLRFVFPTGARKRIARAFRISVETAHDWLRYGVPAGRRADLARVINAELDRIEADIRRIREGG